MLWAKLNNLEGKTSGRARARNVVHRARPPIPRPIPLFQDGMGWSDGGCDHYTFLMQKQELLDSKWLE